MATETFSHENTSGRDAYVSINRLEDGQWFDFTNNNWQAARDADSDKAFTREIANGTGRSIYQFDIDLALLNKGLGRWYAMFVYDNATPASTDVPISDELSFAVELGELGLGIVDVLAALSVKSTAGSTAQASVWMLRNGVLLDLDALDAGVTAALDVREHGAGVDLFNMTFVAGDITEDIFQKEQATPNFVDDRQQIATPKITVGGDLFTGKDIEVVIG